MENSNEITLSNGEFNREYIISRVSTSDEGIADFLFSLGCYEGEKITIISELSKQFVVSIKDGRYSIDRDVADCILVQN